MGKFADKMADRLGDHPAGNHLRGKKWGEIFGSALLALGVLSLVGVWAAATAGYEGTSRFSPNYNLTDNDHWFSKFIPGRTGNLCQPAYINTGQQFRTTNGVFLWEMGKQFNVTMSEIGNNSTMVNFNGTGQQYADNKLEHCDLSGLSVDMDLFQAQVTVKLYATCIDPEWPALLLSRNTYSVDQSRLLDNSLWFTNDLVMKSEYKERNDVQASLNDLANDLWNRQRALFQNAQMPIIRGIRIINENNCGFATDDRKGCFEAPLRVSNDSVGFYLFQNLTSATTMYDPQAWTITTNNFVQSLFAAARYDFASNMTNNIFVNSTARQAVITATEDPIANLTLGSLNQLSGAQSFLGGGDFDPPKISRVRTSYLCIVSKMKPPADFAISVLGLAFALFGVVFGAVMLIVSKLTGKELGSNPVVAAAAPGAALAQVATNLSRASDEGHPDDPEAQNEKNRSADEMGSGNSHAHKVSDGSGGTAVPQYDSRNATPAPSYNYGAKSAQYTPLKNNQSFDQLSDGTPSPSTTKYGFNSFGSLNKLSEQPQMPGSSSAGGASADKSSSSGLAGLAGAAGGGLLGLAGGFLGSKFGSVTPKNLSGTNLQGMAGGAGAADAAGSKFPGAANLQSMAGNIPGAQNLQGMVGNIPGASNLQSMAGNIPGASNLQSMAGNIPGAANLQGMAANVPGASHLQGMAAGVPGASGLGGMASNIPGMPQVSNLATNVPGATNVQGMAGDIPGAASLQNMPGAPNLTAAGLQNTVAAEPSMAQFGNMQNLTAAPSSAVSGLSNAGTAAAAGLAGAGAGALAAGAYGMSKDRPISGDSALYMNKSTIREVPETDGAAQVPAGAATAAGAQVFRTQSNSSLKRANRPTSIDLSGTQPAVRSTKAVPTSPGPPPAATGAGAGVLAAGAGYAALHASAPAQPNLDESVTRVRDFAADPQAAIPAASQIPTHVPTGLGIDGPAANAQSHVDGAASAVDGQIAGANIPDIPAAAQNLASTGQGYIQPAVAASTGAVAGAGGAAILDHTPRSPTVAGPPSFITPSTRAVAGPPTVATPTPGTRTAAGPPASPSPAGARDTTPMSPTSAGPPAGWHK
ncbi:hypothetical protein CcaverHIS002_0400690 [Cutaneotrichosporon cavernicola]|nr:hypothetical protein CcaverHIS002_0400690 [Cutaneotrichosporon cavernicola]